MLFMERFLSKKLLLVKQLNKLPSCEEPARRGGRAANEVSGWLFFGLRRLLIGGYQKTTTPVVFDAFPSRHGGQALRRRGVYISLSVIALLTASVWDLT